MLIGPDDSFDDVVDDVAVGHESEAHACQGVDGCVGVIGGDVAVADLAHGVDAPVESVEVLEVPGEGGDGGVGCS